MLKLYKGMLFGYFLSCIIGLVVLSAVFYSTTQNIILSLVISLIWIFGNCTFFSILAYKRYEKKVTATFNNCRISDYIAENENLIFKTNQRAITDFLKMNLFAGYFSIGNTEKAKQLLFQIEPNFGTNQKGIINESVYYRDLASFYISVYDFEHAKQAIECLKVLTKNPTLKDSQRAQIILLSEETNIIYNMTQNNYDGAKETFAMRLSTANTLIRKVSASYHLANICIHFNETEEAAEYLKFVMENGGDTYYVAKAKELLQQNAVGLATETVQETNME